MPGNSPGELIAAYPRSRGGTPSTTLATSSCKGLSPLARGNRPHPVGLDALQGPIPARAGEPRLPLPCAQPRGAYPRSRGGTFVRCCQRQSRRGLSPLARGNRCQAAQRAAGERPIPARAGEPSQKNTNVASTWAYPRSRGGTFGMSCQRRSHEGLSPLARGNLPPPPQLDAVVGPIPARAGEPRRQRPAPRMLKAYPRSRGGTWSSCCSIKGEKGLSPLARGNLNSRPLQHANHGPIPARAGEPPTRTSRRSDHRAYPRSRGGTTAATALRRPGSGLSPLARGNLEAWHFPGRVQGPIPARAGEPPPPVRLNGYSGAYPRSRGGTARPIAQMSLSLGLSPLARGNLGDSCFLTATLGPIPARAGEPRKHSS